MNTSNIVDSARVLSMILISTIYYLALMYFLLKVVLRINYPLSPLIAIWLPVVGIVFKSKGNLGLYGIGTCSILALISTVCYFKFKKDNRI